MCIYVNVYCNVLCTAKVGNTSPTIGGRSVGIVRSRTQTMEFSFFFFLALYRARGCIYGGSCLYSGVSRFECRLGQRKLNKEKYICTTFKCL
jgi:hypothetical protein